MSLFWPRFQELFNGWTLVGPAVAGNRSDLGYSSLTGALGISILNSQCVMGFNLGERFDREKLKRLESQFPRKMIQNR